MRLITRAAEAAEFVKVWGRACKPPSESRLKLLALGPDPDPNDVDAIVGPGHVFVSCDECGESVEEVIEFTGTHSGCYHDDLVRLCRACLEKTLVMIRTHKEGEAT